MPWASTKQGLQREREGREPWAEEEGTDGGSVGGLRQLVAEHPPNKGEAALGKAGGERNLRDERLL